jgi:hypothetical protein
MNYIIDFSNDPNSLSSEQTKQLNSALVQIVKNKISNLENKYDVKLKFPKEICNFKSNNATKMPLPIIPSLVTSYDVNLFVPFNFIMENISSENMIDGLSTCMHTVNKIKKDLELYSSGKKTKEEIDSSFIEWNDESSLKKEPIYESEFDEALDKKFGTKALIKKLIENLKYSDGLIL